MSSAVGREFFELSPTCQAHRDKVHGKENDVLVPVLSLVQFSRSPFVTFGTIKLDSSKSLPLCIENPTEDAAITVIVDKIPSSRGFSVDQTTFTIPPEDNVIITVTWTPAEEGGVRELLSFIANGIVKHQAILLGKAEGKKLKKKSLWDTIKSKRVPSQGGKVASTPIKATNKTFRVSRQPEYKRNRASNPLKSLNQENNSLKPVGSKEKNSQSGNRVIPQGIPNALYDDLDSMASQNKSPVVLLVPADKIISSMGKENLSSVPLNNPDHRECRVLNKTLSPIGTPERFSNPLNPRFQSPLPVIRKPIVDGNSESARQVLSVEDALAVINSDLSCPVSPPNACSSLNIADSLEDSVDSSVDGNIKTITTVVMEGSPQIDIAQPRLTFYVKATKLLDDEPIPTPCPALHTQLHNGVAEDNVNQEDLKPQKIPINSATVIKSKAGAASENSPDSHKTRTFRRRLLPKTPSLSGLNTDLIDGVSVLPVINSDACVNLKSSKTPPQESEQKLIPQRPSPLSQPQNHTCTAAQPILSLKGENDPNSAVPILGFASDIRISPLGVSEDMFPVQSRTTSQNRKRKSEEYLRESSGCLPTPLEVKQRSETQERKKTCREHQFGSNGKQSLRKITASSSRKSAKILTHKSDAKSTQRGGQTFSSSKVKTKKVIAVAQNRLNFIKPTQTVIPRHPMPFAAKNMFYDERWIEKQERGFTWWMNYVLTPDDFKVATEVTKVNALSLTMGSEKLNIPKPPTKEEMSFRTYTARRQLNRVRRAACQLFTSEKMAKAIKRLEVEVEAKRLLIRKDRHLWKDIGERQKVLNWLLSYNALWLRIGLETIFGELISLESNSDIMGLAMFILGRLLWNPDIAAEFRHHKVPHLYRDGHEETLSRFTLKKLLLLVCFLDQAKESRLIEHDPCLFCMDAEFKTSKDLLLAFSRDFLSGEGILPRHLGLLGLAVSHVQTPLDEFNFAVQNLATDLKCGIRLVRIMEIFIQDWSLSSKLRMPAISRLQKVHNVGVVLQVLKEKGVDLKDEHGIVIDSRDIVDGHREKTLNLLWKIIFSFQVEILLNVEQLKEEICFLRKTWNTKQKLQSLRDNKYVFTRISESAMLVHSSEKLALLMDWVNAVCSFYGLKAENFTVSFSDGRILCYLIHHYHPNHLLAEDIQQETTQTIECGLHSKVELNNSSSDSDNSFDSLEKKDLISPTVNFKILLENERRNFQLVSLAVSYLGAVPAMISPEDMSNTIPNEKVVTCYLSFLCTRLLDLRNETRAARVIQSAWRSYKLQKDIRINELRNQAAKKIQDLVRCFLQKNKLKRQNMAATVIQATWRGHLTREELRRKREAKILALQESSVIVIQRTYREWRARIFLKKSHAVIVLQNAFRIWHARKMAMRKSAAVKIQAWYRMQQCQKRYLTQKTKAILIQAWFRGSHQRREFQNLKKSHRSAVVIQSAFRASLVRKRVGELRRAALSIQMWYMACLLRKAEQKHFHEVKFAAVILQAAFRGWRTRRKISQQNQAALVIQTAYRRLRTRRSFLSLKKSAVVLQRRYRAKTLGKQLRREHLSLKCATIKLQALWRGRAERKRINLLHGCATMIQSQYRRHMVRTKFMALKQAAIVIQKHFKCFRVTKEKRSEFLAVKKAAIVLQSSYRGMRARRDAEKKRKSATVIQSAVRAYIGRKTFLAQKAAAVVLQQHYRAYVLGRIERQHYIRLKKFTISFQAIYRGFIVRRQQKKRHHAATVIQGYFRKYKAQVCYVAVKCAATIIQQHYRSYINRKEIRASYLQLKTATVTIQSTFRAMKVRRNLRNMHRAAAVIQAHVRGHQQFMDYRRQKWATSVIQIQFRANKRRDLVQKQYIAMKDAALCIQAAYRGMKVRKRVLELHMAARVIQRKYRAHKQCKDYQTLKQATILVQGRYRSNLLAKTHRERYCEMRKAATALQAAYRGMRVREHIRTRHRAAKVIQAHVRGHLQLVEYRRQKWAASVIQRQFRANKERDGVQKQYIAMIEAALRIQAAYRGARVRKRFLEMRLAAMFIQRKYRSNKQLKGYQALKQATILVQRRYRASLLAKTHRERYCAMRKAATALQAAYRGMRVRRDICERQRAATVVQTWYRMYRVRERFQAIKIAAILIQRQYQVYKEKRHFLDMKAAALLFQQRYRAILAARLQRKAYLEKYNAVLAIQAGYRGMKVRRQMQIERNAAITLQSHVRKCLNQKYYQRILWATRTIQRHYRANNLRKQAIESFRMKRAAITLQAAFRGLKARRALTQKHQACIIIQSAYRARCARTQYLCMKYAAIAIQQRFRSALAARSQRGQFLRMRWAAIHIQANYRGRRVREEMVLRLQAAIVIQAAFRRHREETKYQAMRLSTIIIQRHYRSYVETKAVREKYLAMKRLAIRLQAAYRGYSVRQDVAKMHSAATVIQAAVKMHKQRSMFRRQKWAAEVIQERFKAWKLGCQQRQKYLDLHYATLCLQKSFRGKKGREQTKRIKAVRTIQAYVRMSIQRGSFMKTKAAAVTIQCAYRAYSRRMQQARMQKSAVFIQQWYRSCSLAQKERKKFKQIQKATLTLQRALRQTLSRRLEKRRLAAIKIQSVLRMHLYHCRYVKLRSCALKVQANFRMRAARRSYLKHQTSAVTIQTCYRAYRAKVEQRHRYRKTLDRIRALQARVRGLLMYRRFQEMRWSAVKIQAYYRGMVERRKFQRRKKSALVIQQHYRAYKLCQMERTQFIKLRNSALLIQKQFCVYRLRKLDRQRRAALKIQAWFRGCQARRDYVSKQTAVATIHRCLQTKFHRLRFHAIQHSVRVIQQRWRETLIARKQRDKFLSIRKSVVVMQALWRATRVRRSIQREKGIARQHRFTAAAYHHLCAMRIQRALRIHWALKAAKKQISSVIYIQRCFLAKLQRRRYLERRQKIIMVQRAVKAWLDNRNRAAVVIQIAAKRFLLRRREERLQCGILKFQALWRGHRSRKLHDTTKIISIRRRLQKVNKEAKEEDKLCHKTTTALTFLLGYQNYAHILTALKHLETATRLSPESCEHLVNSGATHTIFTLIRSCNRSVPSMEVITLAIQVLLNLSKYNRTIDAVYDVKDSVETLLDLLQMYREKAGDKVAEKGGSIFTKACFLLVILVQDEERALAVKKLPRGSERICRIYKLMLQKCKMDAQRTKTNQRMNVSLNGSFLPQATPQKTKPLLRFVPDWVLGKKKMKNIVDPLSAIQALVKSLAIVS